MHQAKYWRYGNEQATHTRGPDPHGMDRLVGNKGIRQMNMQRII